MITKKMIIALSILALIGVGIGISSCNNLDAKVYSVVPNSEFWQTPAEIAAGIAPAYAALQNIPEGDLELIAASSDEMVIPVRGADWLDGNQHTQEWLHTWTPDNPSMNGMWSDIFGGIGKANFTLSIVNSLATPPPNLAGINAELKCLRDYFYFLAIDRFGNVPYVTSFNVDPSTVKTIARASIYDSILTELQANIELLPSHVDATTYGRFTKWAGFALLAKLYMNQDVYSTTTTGSASQGIGPAWQKTMDMCDSIIGSGQYNLLSGYFDVFAPNNSNLTS